MGKLLLLILFLFTGIAQAKLVPTQQLLSESSGVIFDGSMAGGDSIGGGDSPDTRKHTAWFYGNGPVEVCYHVAQNFGVSHSTIGQHIGQAIQEWKDYFVRNKIGEHLNPSQRINQNYILKNQCVGGEDVVLYFGTGPIFGNLRDLQARQTLSRPVAFVNKTHISDDLIRSKGYIRFVGPEIYSFNGTHFPQWSKPNTVYNMIKHEWGHLLGFSHKDQTIMRKDIAKLNFIDSAAVDTLPIDGENLLYPCQSCSTVYEAGLNSLGISSIERKINGEIIIKGSQKVTVQPTYTKSTPLPMTLLSLFEFKSYQQEAPQFSMVNYLGQDYVLEYTDKKATLRKGDGTSLSLTRKGH